VPNTTTARSKAIISMVLALRHIEVTNDPDGPDLTRRFARGDHGCKPELSSTVPCFHPCGDGVVVRA
jgi:hypothetical protein